MAWTLLVVDRCGPMVSHTTGPHRPLYVNYSKPPAYDLRALGHRTGRRKLPLDRPWPLCLRHLTDGTPRRGHPGGRHRPHKWPATHALAGGRSWHLGHGLLSYWQGACATAEAVLAAFPTGPCWSQAAVLGGPCAAWPRCAAVCDGPPVPAGQVPRAPSAGHGTAPIHRRAVRRATVAARALPLLWRVCRHGRSRAVPCRRGLPCAPLPTAACCPSA